MLRRSIRARRIISKVRVPGTGPSPAPPSSHAILFLSMTSSPLVTHLLPGSLTFFAGPMFSGKTLELVRHLQIFQEQQIPSICLRPAFDTRTPVVQSKSGLLMEGTLVEATNLERIRELMSDKFVIGIDEIQFFTTDIVPLLEEELRKGKTILVAGLDNDFRGKVFPVSHALMAIPETVLQRSRSVCSVCRQYNATRTQRLRNGVPVTTDESSTVLENSQQNMTYEARCLAHHVI